jgi:hypothetical protein
MAGISTRDTYGRVGVPRVWGMVVGVALLLLALGNVLAGRHGLKVGGHTVLMLASVLDIVYGVTGAAALVAAYAGEVAVKLTLRAIGVVLAALVILGLAARASIGQALGFPTKIPMAINLIDLLAAVAVLAVALGVARLRYAAD